MGSVALPAFVVVHHTPMICNLHERSLWNRMTSYGHYKAYIPLGAVGTWQLKGGVDAHMSGQFEICHINRGEYYKAPVLDATTASEDIQLGDVELRSTYRRSLYVWIKGVHTITSPVI